METILWVVLGASVIAVLICAYRFFSTKRTLERLTKKHSFIHQKPHHRHSEPYYGSTIPGIGPASDFSGTSTGGTDWPIGGSGEFGGAGASGSWGDGGGGDK